MKRLYLAEKYLKERQSYIRLKRIPLIFYSYGEPQSFPVQYFAGLSEYR